MTALETLPPLPNWTELHPLVVHFPIALLLVAPLFIVVGIIGNAQKGRPFLVAALLLMVLGTGGIFLAGATGEAAGEVAHHTASLNAVLDRHEELAEATRMVFSVLTAVFASLLFLPRLFKIEATGPLARILPLAFLLLYTAGAVLLVNTAHHGGRLVHELGIHSGTGQTNPASTTPDSSGGAVTER